jgi:hypothetical protein
MRLNLRKARTQRALLLGVAAASAAAVWLGLAPTALAANCPPPPSLVNPFLPWQDSLDYVTVTNGSFEPIGAGSKDQPWTFAKSGVHVVSDNEPWHVNGSQRDAHALLIAAGDQATSACTTAPNIAAVVRFFAKNVGGADGRLHVEILVNGGKNGILDGGYVSAGQDWQPTSVITLPWAKPLKGAVDLRVRLTPVGTDAAFEVDDVYIDPCRSR